MLSRMPSSFIASTMAFSSAAAGSRVSRSRDQLDADEEAEAADVADQMHGAPASFRSPSRR